MPPCDMQNLPYDSVSGAHDAHDACLGMNMLVSSRMGLTGNGDMRRHGDIQNETCHGQTLRVFDLKSNTGYSMDMGAVYDQLRKAIQRSGMTHYAIAKQANIDHAQFCRFMQGDSGLSVETIERLAKVLDLKITISAKRKRG